MFSFIYALDTPPPLTFGDYAPTERAGHNLNRSGFKPHPFFKTPSFPPNHSPPMNLQIYFLSKA